MKHVDAVLLGGGQASIPLAIALAHQGKNVVLIDPGPLGGTCVNRGCTPSKAFLAGAHAVGRARRAKPLGLRGEVSLDFAMAMERVASVIAQFRRRNEEHVAAAGVTVIRTKGRFVGERSIQAGSDVFVAPLVVVNTGTSAAIPDVPGLASSPYVTNATFFDQRDLPRRFGVIGGGYIGLELGQGMARSGSEVHVFQHGPRVLPAEEPDATALLERSLVDDGVTLHLGASITGITCDAKTTYIEVDGVPRVAVDRILVATGRVPNTAEIGAKASGIELDARGYVAIDDRFLTSCPGVYAIGDVAGQPAFTHVAWEDHRRMLDILGGGSRTRNDRVLAYSTFTEPQLGRAGYTLEAALAKGITASAITLPLGEVARGIEWGAQDGFFRAVIDDDSQRFIGATLVGYEASELIHILLAYIQNDLTWQELDRSVHIHPTFAEGLPTLARMFAGSSGSLSVSPR